MRKLFQFVFAIMTGIGIMLMTERQAHAYADPGSSLLILQTVGSVVTAAGLYFRRRIASLFRRGKSPETDAAATESTVSAATK
jgi:hypothetical protein